MRRLLTTALALAASASLAHAATITIVNGDAAGEGFNDPTVVAPVGGNPGATLGAQRLYVFQHAANLWGAILPSTVEVLVNAQFNPLTCTATSGVLGSAGPVNVFRDFAGAPIAGHWYHGALANKLVGSDLSANADINATFNSSLGTATCLPSGWYLGVDGNEGGQIELLPVVLHELGHGLGFSTTTSGSTGNYLSSFPHAWDAFLRDNATGLRWDAMTPTQRIASAISCNGLSWAGPSVALQKSDYLGSLPLLRITAPAGVAGDYDAGVAQFGAPLNSTGVTGPVELVNDTFGNPTNACEAISNDLTGKIAFLDRGTCGFNVKVKNAQNAGAIGVIVADTVAGCPPAGMGGVDATITIPSVRITLADGNLLRAQLGAGLTATLINDPARFAGTDAGNRVKMYAPTTFAGGSSVSHFDVSAEPSLLMEPAITGGLSSNVDLTRALFADLGWFNPLLGTDGPALRSQLGVSAPNPMRGATAISYTLVRPTIVDLRVYDLSGREIARLENGMRADGRHTVRWEGVDSEGRVVPPGVYRYRLKTASTDESRTLVVVR